MKGGGRLPGDDAQEEIDLRMRGDAHPIQSSTGAAALSSVRWSRMRDSE